MLIEDVLWNHRNEGTSYSSGTNRRHTCVGVRLSLLEWAHRSLIEIAPLKDAENPVPAIGLGFTISVSKIPELRAALKIMESELAQKLREAADTGDPAAVAALKDYLTETA